MFAINNRLTATLILTLVLATSAVAQQPQPTAPPAKESEYVQEKGFKSKVFELKNRVPGELIGALRPLGSGFKGATIYASEGLKTLSVRDFPENIAAIEEAIKRLDVPQPTPTPSPDIEFHVHILVAGNTATTGEDFPAELTDVIKQMQGTLKYKSYGVMASAVHHATTGGSGVSNNGVAESKLFNVNTPLGNPIFFNYNLSPLRLNTEASPQSVTIGSFRFHLRIPLNVGTQTQQQIQYQDVGFETPVTVREGEKVVVGTTTMGDKGLIVVVSAKFQNK